MDSLILKAGREKSLKRRHPWIFSGAVQAVNGSPGMGDTVEVRSAGGELLGSAAYSPQSSIRARMWDFGENAMMDVPEIISSKMRIAISFRINHQLLTSSNNSIRLIHAESDGLPGLIVDQYYDWLVVQCLSAGIEKWKSTIVDQLAQITGIRNIYERSDVDVRALEGLPEVSGVLKGEEPPEELEIIENGMHFLVDIQRGHKTGFYLDQRDNRLALQKYVRDKRVLNCFAYTGGFTLYSLAGGAAHVTSIESSTDALELEKCNLSLNQFPEDRVTPICADVFQELRAMRDRREEFDVIILDPPKFAPTTAQVQAAARGYKDINLLAFKLLKNEGILATFSCSGGVSRSLFQKIVADAALDAGVDAQVLENLSQARDHPVALNFPEGEYLKGLVCRVIK